MATTTPTKDDNGKVDLGDTRPKWMSDPSLTEVDQDIIKLFEDRANRPTATQFASNVTAPDASTPLPTTPVNPVSLPDANGNTGAGALSTDSGVGVGGDAVSGPGTPPAPAIGTTPTIPPPVAPVVEPVVDEVPAGMFRVPLDNGQHVDITQQDALNLIRQDQWMQSQPQHVRDAWARVVRGDRVVSQQELADIQAQAEARVRAQIPQTQSQVPDLSTLSPEQRAYVERLQSTVQTAPVYAPNVQQPAQQLSPVPDSYAQQQTQQQIAAQAAHMAQVRMQQETELNAARAAIGTQYSLTSDQLSRLDAVTQQLNVVPAIVQRKRVYSPLGDVIAEPSFGDVVREAYDYAMSTDPQLRDLRDEYVYNQRVATLQASEQATNQKKGRAGSLASAPSAAVSSGQISPAKMTPQQQTAAMAAFLANSVAEGTIEN